YITSIICSVGSSEKKFFAHLCISQTCLLEGHYIRAIDPDSSAEKAGLQDGDRLLVVSGVATGALNHDEVVNLICAEGEQVGLCPQSANELKASRNAVNSHRLDKISGPQLEPPPSPPRLCKLSRGPHGFGFHLNGIRGMPGHYIRAIDPDSSAEKAGLQDGDRLLVVSGVATGALNHDEVVNLICAEGEQVSFTLLDPDSDQWYTKVSRPLGTTHLIHQGWITYNNYIQHFLPSRLSFRLLEHDHPEECAQSVMPSRISTISHLHVSPVPTREMEVTWWDRVFCACCFPWGHGFFGMTEEMSSCETPHWYF
uniref:PDZ domain-containing protein n=1 Tax=Eptatretus burgeri TaxID=7764 RepID=A0A8C4NLX3_EPTBU